MEDALTPAWVREDNACVYVTLSRVSGSKSSNRQIPRGRRGCALLTNVGVVELVNRGSGITGASLLMFVPVLLVGYGLHAWYLPTRTSRPKFARYTLAAVQTFPCGSPVFGFSASH